MPQAIPGTTSPVPPRSGGSGLLRVVSNAELDAADAQRANAQASPSPSKPDLGAFIRRQWEFFRNHRNQGDDPLSERLLRAQRMFQGRYDPAKLSQIRAYGGSEVYARVVAVKCRGATSLLRDVYLGPDRPWDIQPQPDPPVPATIRANVMQLVGTEARTKMQAGEPISEDQVHMRILGLMHAAEQAARRNAMTQAAGASDKVESILSSGGFYEALGQFLTDLPLFPYAVMKGPVVRMVPQLVWQDGTPSMQSIPQMFWERKSPFDIYWTPGADNFADATIIERQRLSRSDLNDLLGLPGYDEDAIRAALRDYGSGLRDWLDSPDTEQAINEGRENPNTNRSEMIDSLEFHGSVQGSVLLDQGMDPATISDPDRDYAVQAWVVGRHTIKVMLNPSPRQRHPYFLTSFEKVPGTVSGHGLPDLLEDIQEVCNASLRNLVNNMGIASGPQVVVNDEALISGDDGSSLYPWKRWHIQNDPMGNQREPITFFQPNSNAQELLTVYTSMTNLADEISAIPRYITGSSQGLGGAGRTASGLSMLMGNAEKVLQTVASNVDTDVMSPLLTALYDMIMLTDQSKMLTGEEKIRVRGVNVAVQKETERQKQLQFLQITANPIDAPIIGPMGRARVLRSVAQNLGLPDDVVPDDQTLQSQLDAQKQMETASNALHAAAQGQGPPGQQQPPQPDPKNGAPAAQGPAPNRPSPGAQAQGAQAPAPTPEQLSDHAPPVNLQQQGLPA